jgi:hypothetical protein
MTCRYCNVELAPSRNFIDGQFCCEDHRQAFELGDGVSPAAGEQFSTDQPTDHSKGSVADALRKLRIKFPPVARATASPTASKGVPEYSLASHADLEAGGGFEAEFVAPESLVQGQPAAGQPAGPHRDNKESNSWLRVKKAWKVAPRDLKLVSLLFAVLLVVASTRSLSQVRIHQIAPRNMDQVQGQVQKVVLDHWKNLNQSISDRAAVAYADDFRSGLDAWESRSNLTRSWSYDAAGFVQPGPLAVFKPTVDLSDYSFEFLGEIDQKAIGWAFRAEDLNNYYAMKFVVVKPGPLPLIHIVRYAVIHGKEGPHVVKPLPITVRPDMLYRILVNVRGEDFTITAQGQVVDFWSDNRLQRGGVGFFSNRGERARLHWVEVSHQYDALGRLCAYLAPYGIEGRNGNSN